MLQFIKVKLQQIAVHNVGNKLYDEKVDLSSELTELKNEETIQILLKYFLSSFSNEELYKFYHQYDINFNEVYVFIDKIFQNENELLNQSINISKHLYDSSLHPNIKGGEFYVVYFKDLMIDTELVDGIGLFKSELKEPFLKVNYYNKSYSIDLDKGLNIKRLDKGCLILNIDREFGYKVCLIDNLNKSSEAQYWKDEFLNVKPIANEFFQTNQFLSVAKNFVTKQFSKEFEVSRAEQIDLLNKSVEYFKLHETFDKNEFETDVFKNQEVIDSFRNFDSQFRQDNDIELSDQFDISQKAVKKQARIFKSVLKLDKNFHIYIHGDRELIQQGVDPDGRKYYKIYFKEES